MDEKNLTKIENISNIQITVPAKDRDSSSSNRRVSLFNAVSDSSKEFPSEPISFNEQLELLKSRGLIVEDEEFALKLLKEINYFRLECYLYSYYKPSADSFSFYQGVSFNLIYKQYCFDQELRSLVFSALSVIEIAFRTRFAYELNHSYGAFPFKKHNFRFKRENEWEFSYSKLISDMNTSKEPFAKQYRKVAEEPLLPIWAMVEIMSFGEISLWYDKYIKDEIKNRIAKYFSVPMRLFTSWIRTLSLVRNICAHHARLWNRRLPITLMIPENPKVIHTQPLFATEEDGFQNHKRIYNVLLATQYLLAKTASNENSASFMKEVLSLIDRYGIEPKRMGFPINRLSLDELKERETW